MFARLLSRIVDRFTSPMSGREWDYAQEFFPTKVKAYHRGVITHLELARLIRA